MLQISVLPTQRLQHMLPRGRPESLHWSSAVADPDFKLRRGPGSILLAQPAFPPSVISSYFTQNKGGGGEFFPQIRH